MGNDQRSHDESDPDSTGASRLSDDQFYRALASKQRRRLLYYLLDGEERTVDELATVLTGWQAGDTGAMQTPDDREQVAIKLYHVHLPLLVEAGLISCDSDLTVVRIESLDSTVEDVISGSVASEPPES